MLTRCAIGVDLGGTKSAAGLVTLPEGQVLARRLAPTEPQRGGPAVLATVAGLVQELKLESERLGFRPVALGLGIAELVDVAGRIVSAATIDWRGFDPIERLQAECRLPTRIDADVRVAARAEAKWGAGQHAQSFLFITVGTGISASLVIEGQPYAGARGLTGTFASAAGLATSEREGLVRTIPLEHYASGPAIAARYQALHPTSEADAREVLALSDAGETDARQVVESAGAALGSAIAALVNMLDPDRIVLGGGLGLAGGVYLEALDEALRGGIWSEHHRGLPLVLATLGVDAGLMGAALLSSEEGLQ